jgi:hypothetical protein
MNKKSLVLFVGNVDSSLQDVASQYSPKAKLIEPKDVSTLNKLSVGYISIGDHTIEDFITVLDHASEIFYVPSNSWHHPDTQKQTEYHLRLFSHKTPVHNLDKIPTDNMLYLADSRKTEEPQLWVAGCSSAIGTGVEKHQTYGAAVGRALNLSLSVLAEPGSSLLWASDQILRSNIRKDDIVIWGITGVSRFPFYRDNSVTHVNIVSYQKFPEINQIINKKILVSDHILYLAVTSIQKVIEQARTIGYKLVLMQLPLNPADHELYMQHYLSQFECVIRTYSDSNNSFIDYGSDGEHPGPLQHQYYAQLILDYLKK